MEPSSLTRKKTRTKAGRGVGSYTWRGHEVRMVDDALNALEIYNLFDGANGVDKMPELLGLLFPDELYPELIGKLQDVEAEALEDLIATLLWDAFGMDATGEHSASWEAPAFDFDEDAGRIRSSLLIAYGMDWDEAATKFSYAEFCDLLGGLVEAGIETPFREAIIYRTGKPPKDTKENKEYREAWLRRKAHFALKASEPTPEQMAQSHNDAMAGMFAAAEKAAMAHG